MSIFSVMPTAVFAAAGPFMNGMNDMTIPAPSVVTSIFQEPVARYVEDGGGGGGSGGPSSKTQVTRGSGLLTDKPAISLGGRTPEAAARILRDITEAETSHEVNELLESAYDRGMLAHLILTLEEKFIPIQSTGETTNEHAAKESMPVQSEDAISDKFMGEVRKMLEEVIKEKTKEQPTMDNEPEFDALPSREDFGKAWEVLKRLESKFLSKYRDPASVTRDEKLGYVEGMLDITRDSKLLEMIFDDAPSMGSSLMRANPTAAKRLWAQANQDPKLLDYLFQLNEVGTFLIKLSHTKYKEGEQYVSGAAYLNHLLNHQEGNCTSLTALFAHFASLVGLKIHAGYASQHVFIITDSAELAVECTRNYSLTTVKPTQWGGPTKFFGTQRRHAVATTDGIMGWITSQYYGDRLPADAEIYELKSKMSGTATDYLELAGLYLTKADPWGDSWRKAIRIYRNLLIESPDMIDMEIEVYDFEELLVASREAGAEEALREIKSFLGDALDSGVECDSQEIERLLRI